MSRLPLPPPEPTAVNRMVAAVVALSEDPKRTNVDRYLAASRALEQTRVPRHARTKRAA